MTSASHGAFTGTFTVVAVPLLVGLSGRKIANRTWTSAAAALLGTALSCSCVQWTLNLFYSSIDCSFWRSTRLLQTTRAHKPLNLVHSLKSLRDDNASVTARAVLRVDRLARAYTWLLLSLNPTPPRVHYSNSCTLC